MKSKVLVLINNAYETNTSDFIEIIKMFLLNEVNIHLVIAKAENSLDDFYKENDIEIEILSSKSKEKSPSELLKNIIRNSKTMCAISCYLLALIKNILFMWKYKKARNKKEYVTNSFLTKEMSLYVPRDDYDFLWVHDEVGLLWAENMRNAQHLKCPVVHHCIELYWEHFLLQKRRKLVYYNQYVLFEYAKRALMNVDLIVIQDLDRWNVLCKYTGASEKKHVFFPVSVYDYELNTADPEGVTKIIYYPTMIAEKRGCIELIKMFESIKDRRFQLEIHGIHADPGYIKQLKKLELPSNIVLSNYAMSYRDLLQKHRQIWCVFIYYGEDDDNDKYVVNSSNKIAMALQAGKPIISIGNQKIGELCREYGCGIALEKWNAEELKSAIELLDQRYEVFCRCARECYDRKYNASNFYGNILGGMREVKS